MSAKFFESLEKRQLMSATLRNGVLTIEGTELADVIAVSQDATRVRVNENGVASAFAASQVRSVVVNAKGGNDQILGRTNLKKPLTLRGGEDNDTLVGGAAADTFEGGAGTDLADYSIRKDNLKITLDDVANDGAATGAEADNVKSDVENVRAGSGNDSVTGSSEANVLEGGAGNDAVHGEGGNDTLRGEAGNDRVAGGAGDDLVHGHDGNDTLWGNVNPLAVLIKKLPNYLNEGKKKTGGFLSPLRPRPMLPDFILALSTDRDTIYGGNGNDTAAGGPDADTINGDANNDTLKGGDGADLLRGGAGDDAVYGEAGNDTAWGDTDPVSASLFKPRAGGALGGIRLGGGIVLPKPTFIESDNDIVDGGAGDDNLNGNAGNDWLVGGPGNDKLDGAAGNDRLFGDANIDTLIGGPGADLLDGGDGVDSVPSFEADVIRVAGKDVYGEIGRRWIALGGESSFLGAPHNSETGTPDGVGRYNHFDGGSIYWTPATGAQVIYGAIRDKWASLGWERSGLGYPTSDELPAPGGGRMSRFQNGEIYWSPMLGAVVNSIKMPLATDSPQFDDWSCGPNSVSRVLRYYGINADYSTVRSVQLRDSDLVSRFKMGSRPGTLLGTMRRWKADAQRESRTSFSRVLQLLGQGKPVVALVGWGRDFTIGLGAVPSTLHYVALTGYDMKTSKIFYTDTDGGQKEYTFDEFNQKWNWYSSGAKGGFLTGTLDVPERTILY